MWIIEVIKNKRGKWFSRIKSGNGLIVYHANGKGYSRRQAALKTAKALYRDMHNVKLVYHGE